MTRRPVTTLDESSGEYEEFLATFGSRLKAARLKAGLTQAKVAEKANFKQSYIFELESGSANITLKTLARIADVLEMDPRDLLPERGSVPLSQSGIERLLGALAAVAKHQERETELVSELQSLAQLRISLETALKAAQATAQEHPPKPAGSRGAAGKLPR